ncbi:MAG: MBL fold metallo-hydrolase [Nitrospiraceae bacterium]|nr:MBL fold metallo-hydrolase [Nitrospiraceae bacterium]
MRFLFALFLSMLLPLTAAGAGAKGGTDMDMLKNIHWLGHDTFRINAGKVIYTDPFRIRERPVRAGIILITHEHYDHCSPEDVAKIQGPDTVIVAPPDCAAKLKGNIHLARPGDRINIEGIGIEAVRSYNVNKKFHPKGNDWVGYIFTAGGKRIYIAGDTDLIPEMKDYRCDIALLPVSGTYVMTAEEAVQAALEIRPGVAIPMHYGSIVGTKEDAERFRKLLETKIKAEGKTGPKAVLLPQEEQ